jgi:hypothetical protein
MNRLTRVLAVFIVAATQAVPAQDTSVWQAGDWMDFIEEAVTNIIDYGLDVGAAGGVGGAMPLTDLYSGLAALPHATRQGLRIMLEGRMQEANFANDLQRLDLYQAYYTALTTGDHSRLDALKAQHQRALAAMAHAQQDSLGLSIEPGIDRPGSDFQAFDLDVSDPTLCQSACVAASGCLAWTYVAPFTVQGPRPRCWLKSSVPAPEPNACCTSGVVPRQAVPTSGATTLPAMIELCETGGREICATLQLDPWSRGYDLRGSNGAHGVVSIDAFGPGGVSFSRADRDGVSAGLTASYQGRLTGPNSAEGEVVWSWTWGGPPQTRSGTWRAHW